jgi:transcription initiation factor IIE alpha subunit
MTSLYSSKGIIEAFNHIDGRKTIADIRDAVEAELWSEGYSARHSLSLEELKSYLRLLHDAQVIDMKKN